MVLATPVREHQLLIGGRWVAPAGSHTATIDSPVTGEPVAVVAAAEPADVDRAVAAARAAFEANRWRSPFERAAELERVADVLDARTAELADALVLEHGKPHAEAVGEVGSTAAGFRLAAAEARRLTGETIPAADPSKRVMTFRHPRGVVAAITPWNFPLNIPIEYVGPALAAGNAVILKPAPTTAGLAALLAQCIIDAGLPAGLFSLLTGPSVEMSKALVSHAGVNVVGFTGSSAAGAAIARVAGDKELVMELGGNGPVIVLDDTDLDRAIPAIAGAAFFNAGQSCAAAERILVSARIHDALVAGLADAARSVRLGDPRDAATTMGPVNNEGVAAKMDAHVADATGHGARLASGGHRATDRPTRLYYEPTVLANVAADALVHSEETFGPIAPVTPCADDAALLALANASDLGLSSAVFTRDLDRAFWFADRLQTGQVVINDTSNYWELHLPFGGWSGKHSGRGRVGGRYIFESMTQLRSVSINLNR